MPVYRWICKNAYLEDTPDMDITKDIQLDGVSGIVKVVSNSDLILSGSKIFEECIRYHDPDADISWKFKDGDIVLSDQTVCLVTGLLAKMFCAKQVAMNFFCHLSGVATLTRCYTEKLPAEVRLLCTGFTPLLKKLEKYAVEHGGGDSIGAEPSDLISIKKHHVVASNNDLARVLDIITKTDHLPIQVEVFNMDEANVAIKYDIDRIWMINMSNADIEKLIKIIPPTIQKGVGGGIDLKKLKEVSLMGVDYIRVGIANRAPSVDMSFHLVDRLGH